MFRIIIGGVIVVIGAVIILKSEWFYRNFGAIPWAEQHLGTEGGSRTMYKIIGGIVVAAGFMIMMNLMGGLISIIFSPLTRGLQ
ncbi:hypothetical protein KKA15_01605 [Patescibacteria group bacterium]|nr:hypothetical protein [Patescibacteria group bacterium]